MPSKLTTFLLSLAVGVTAVGGARGEENKRTHHPPDLKDARSIGGEWNDILEDISGKETWIEFYKMPSGTITSKLVLVNKKGERKTLGYLIDTDGKPPYEFQLMDLDGVGKLTRLPVGNIRNTNKDALKRLCGWSY